MQIKWMCLSWLIKQLQRTDSLHLRSQVLMTTTIKGRNRPQMGKVTMTQSHSKTRLPQMTLSKRRMKKTQIKNSKLKPTLMRTPKKTRLTS